MCTGQHLIFMGVLKIDLGDAKNLTNWKAKQLLNNVVFASGTFSDEDILFHSWHRRSNLMVGLDISISQHERKRYKRSEKFCPHHSPCSSCFYFNKPKAVKKCKKGVNMMYHVYTITSKQNEKMYIGQSVNPIRQLV